MGGRGLVGGWRGGKGADRERGLMGGEGVREGVGVLGRRDGLT